MKKRRTLVIVLAAVIGHVLLSFLAVGLFWSSLTITDSEKSEAINYYSKDSTYFYSTGSINEAIIENGYYKLKFEWIETSFADKTNSIFNKKESFIVYSNEIEKVWLELDPYNGVEISFMVAPGKPSISFNQSIVQISYGDKEILSFEEGKDALLKELEKI